MFGNKYIQVLLLFLVHSILALILIFKTSGLPLRLEIVLFLFMTFVSLIYLFGLFFEEGWAWVLVMLFYAVGLINLLFLNRWIEGHYWLFTFAFIFDIIGFFKAIANIGEDEEDLEIEPYESEEMKEKQKVEVYEQAEEPKKTVKKAAKSSKRKKAKKKSKKKK